MTTWMTASGLSTDLPFAPISDFLPCRGNDPASERLVRIKETAPAFRSRMRSGQKALFYKTCDLIRVPYPVKYGLLNASTVLTPYMHILNRLFIVQFEACDGSMKTLLFSPSDARANAETPFFKRLSSGFGVAKDVMTKFLAPEIATVEAALAETGIRPEQVDYLSYDHLHTQDVRRWLGVNGQKGVFPNAKLLVMRTEWLSTKQLLPPQRDWYCPDGIAGIDEDRVVLLNGDTFLGGAVAFIQTPGHTEGNHSLVVHTPEGLLVSSENGVSADSYAPQESEIPGVRQFAKTTGMEVVLNGNTLERGLEQYLSMILERDIAGPSARDARFFNVVPSSELTSYWGFPGLKPTFSFGPLSFGSPHV